MPNPNSTKNPRIDQLTAARRSLELARSAFDHNQEAIGVMALAVALRYLPAADRAAVLARFEAAH